MGVFEVGHSYDLTVELINSGKRKVRGNLPLLDIELSEQSFVRFWNELKLGDRFASQNLQLEIGTFVRGIHAADLGPVICGMRMMTKTNMIQRLYSHG